MTYREIRNVYVFFTYPIIAACPNIGEINSRKKYSANRSILADRTKIACHIFAACPTIREINRRKKYLANRTKIAYRIIAACPVIREI